MHVLSVDPGYKNFAYCIVQVSDDTAVDPFERMQVMSCKLANVGNARGQSGLLQCCLQISKLFDDDPYFGQISTVLIETQMGTNAPCIKIAQHVASHCMLKLPGCKVHFVSAKIKLRVLAAAADYTERKSMSVKRCIEAMGAHKNNFQVLSDALESILKHDDLCDCVVQCAAFFSKQ